MRDIRAQGDGSHLVWAVSERDAVDALLPVYRPAGYARKDLTARFTGVTQPAGVNLDLVALAPWELHEDMDQADGPSMRRFRVRPRR